MRAQSVTNRGLPPQLGVPQLKPAVTSGRRKGVQSSETRAQLLRGAIQILGEEGAAAVTARRLAEQVGLGRHIVHYYFGTIDEVFVAIMREEGARTQDALAEATRTGDALKILWDNAREAAPIIVELMQLGLRHPSIAREYKLYAERFREAMSQVLARYAQDKGLTLPASPAATALLLQSVAFSIAIEGRFDLNMGHAEAEAHLLGWLAGQMT